ncbi:MAG: hypothetical protein IPN80_09985 [Flavobacterium sp.]|nr:hypothetical protein [Flavobacterium sp.]
MEAKDYLRDIQDIKNMMSQSTQFISLSGLSGVLAGIYAIIGAAYIHNFLAIKTAEGEVFEGETFNRIVLVALFILIISVLSAYVFTVRKARRIGEKVWNASAKRLLINFCIPLCTGGILILLLFRQGLFELIAPLTLIFYGLACLNASKYTLRDVRFLGITEIMIGLIAVEFSDYALYFWVLGFGVCHIVYGTMMYLKYDRK